LGWLAGPDAAEEIIWYVSGEAPELSYKLWRFAVAHLKGKELMDVLFFGRGQPPHQFVLQLGLEDPFCRRCDDIFYFRGLPVVQLPDHLAELGFLVANASQVELCFSFGERHCWSLGPEWRKSHSHCLFLLVLSFP
jgi:hypothetical protein